MKSKLSFRGKIFVCFVLCCACVVLLRQNIEALYLALLKPDEIPWEVTTLREWVIFVAGLFSFALGAFVFYKITSRIIKAESQRRVQEQNLIYASIAHDLKTPMTSVQGFAKALMDGKVKPEEQREIFEVIYRKSCTMNDMVNTLFDYAKLGTENYHTEQTSFDLCSLVRGIVAENYTDLEEHGIQPELDLPDKVVTITGEKTEMKRAITNLVVNVYKHNPAGIQAAFSLHQQQDRAILRIADSGKPLPEDMDIFEPFVTENTARTAGHGTGLGLAITKRIIQRHGGHIRAEAARDEYTKVFVVTLPTNQ
ncbi:MAG: HAMP domain-containing histidine kinase [Clostridia bacterium]|nr:HAMP domain-containing histidine kinase [Clostridia bacterium]MBP3649654.1 HAMP domain-containing histidine kinase [Clostridia bacterium]